jgi:cysteine-rich repeat protein
VPCTPTVFCFPPEGACCDAAPGPGCTDGLTEEDCDAIGGTWLGQDTTCDDPDCNDNQQNDDCDIAQGISEDCNNNGVPDECDIANGTSEDCQPDGIPDECQLTGDGRLVIWDNGPFVTHPGGGCNGDDLSELCTAIGGSVYGYGAQVAYDYRIADDFTLDTACTIDSIRVYAYQTGAAGGGSTLTAVNMQIWDGSPMAGGSVIWGDTVTNIMTGTDATGAWRALDSDPTACNRSIKYADVNIGGVMLDPGTYWIDYQFDGTLSSGPWAPPVTLPCTPGTGNALQWTGSWAPVTDTGGGWPEDFPFIIDGYCGPLENDCNGNGVPDECDEPVCGNDCLEGGAGQYPDDEEECDGELDDACPGECYPPGSPNECMCPFCGDGVVGDDEECDDGNNEPCDGCDELCRVEECGNGRVDCNEECDDGNTTPCDGCDDLCRTEACGNGRVECDEECDDGNTNSEDGCSAQCIIEFCGDGITQPGLGEQCDDGNNEDEDGCNANCQLEFCGDGVVQEGLGEECDDGNNEDGDGCSFDCLDEAPEAIPTVSTWGLLILALLLLVAGKVYFGRRRARVSA